MIKSLEEKDQNRRELIKNSYDTKKIKAQEEKYAKEVAEKRLPPQEKRNKQTLVEKEAFDFQRAKAESEAPRAIRRQNDDS